MRPHLHCLVCCCSAFLPKEKNVHDSDGLGGDDDYYKRLGLNQDATYEEIRRAYKRRSLAVHPDKIAQRGSIADADHNDFQRLKEAYETLSDPRKRDLYDALGPEAMRYLIDPSQIDTHAIFENFHNSSFFERSKIFLSVVTLIGFLLLQPILICLKVDGIIGDGDDGTHWFLLLIPLWIIDVIVFLALGFRFHRRLKRKKSRWFHELMDIVNWLAIVVAQIFLALKLDGILNWDYLFILAPIGGYEFIRLVQSIEMIYRSISDTAKMVTLSFIEHELGKSYSDLTPEERDEVNKCYIIVHPVTTTSEPDDDDDARTTFRDEMLRDHVESSPEFAKMKKKKSKALNMICSVVLHGVFLTLLVLKLDNVTIDWSWWLVFTPIWVSIFLICAGSCCTISSVLYSSSGDEVIVMYKEKEEQDDEVEMVEMTDVSHLEEEGNVHHQNEDQQQGKERYLSIIRGIMSSQDNESQRSNSSRERFFTADSFSVGSQSVRSYHTTHNGTKQEEVNGNSCVIEIVDNEQPFEVSGNNDEKKEFEDVDDPDYGYEEYYTTEQRDDYPAMEDVSQALGICCLLIFYIAVTCLFVGKLEGGYGSYSSFWIIFPLLVPVGIMLCCFCCAIYCTPDMDAVHPKNSEPTTTQDATTSGITEDHVQGLPESLSDLDRAAELISVSSFASRVSRFSELD